jgi:hypothetical protein
MKINSLDSGNTMIEISLTEALNHAGVYNSDSDFERDCKLIGWIGRRKHRCIEFDATTYSVELARAVADGIEVLIIKEK